MRFFTAVYSAEEVLPLGGGVGALFTQASGTHVKPEAFSNATSSVVETFYFVFWSSGADARTSLYFM